MALAASASSRAGIRLRLTSTARALLALVVLALLLWLAVHRDVHLALAAVVASAVAVDAAFARWALRDVEIDLRGPSDGRAHAPTRWDLHITGWRRPFVLHPLLVWGLGDLLVDDGRPATLSWPPMGRGVVSFTVFDAIATGPLGLVTAGRRLVQQLREPVHLGPPPIEPAGRWPKPLPVGFGPIDGAPIGDELFRSIRPYRRGDERRRIHWKATAHHGTLMVRELDGTGAIRVRIVVELGMPGPAAEHAASQAAGVAEAALARGWHVELVTVDASSVAPALTDAGRIFRRPPVVSVAAPTALPTVTAAVRSPREVQRRLATTATGRPSPPPTRGATGRVCHVSPAGVVWT